MQQGDALAHGFLERLAAGDKPHAAGPFVDDGRYDRFLQVAVAVRFAARID